MLKLREPVSGLTHFAGALLSAVALIVLVSASVHHASVWHVVSFAVFGASLILLYSASAMYHLLPVSPGCTRVLRRIDHSMIYILIAGTYTPFCLVPLRGPWGWSLLAAIWAVGITGIVLKMCWFDMPRWLSAGTYLVMGWLVVVAFSPLVHSMPAAGVAWIVAGGVLYSAGAVIYALKRPNIADGLGFHEIFHLFVLAGSLSHFWVMYRYIMYV